MKDAVRKIIIGITGASGAIYGLRALQMTKALAIESHLVVSRSARLTIAAETNHSLADIQSLADFNYAPDDIGATISSGSFRTMGMIVAPCSVRSLAEIANGVTTQLLTRAADVTLKERRRLVLMVRETPFHLGHLRNMVTVTEMGAIVAPPVPAFYNQPQSIDDIVTHSVGRVLDLFDLDCGAVQRWSGLKQAIPLKDV